VEPVIITAISALTSVLVAVVGAWVARRKGLPGINAEIETRNAELIRLLEGQLAALRAELQDGQADFNECKAKLSRALDDNAEMSRRLSLAEGDLLWLYRQTGRRPPQRLQRPKDPG
jgi:septal ring factor EnvC (AmiA/AmiB activator)